MNTCLNCKNTTNNPKFCSRSCAATYTNRISPKRKLTRKCSKCSNIVRNYRTLLCEEHWKEYQSNKTIELENRPLLYYWSKKSLESLHISSKNAHIRALGRYKFKELLKLPCANCNYSKHVELCHIKPIKDFSETSSISEINSDSNIIQLCPNCHWEFDKGLLKIEEIIGLEPI